MKAARARRLALFTTAWALAVIDLALKAGARHALTEPVDLHILQLRLAYNTGAAFSLGDALPTGTVLAATGIITVAMAAYGWRAAPTANRGQRLAGAAVLGGAAGNVIDRATYGAVTDYLHTGWWPTFNLADVFIVCGVALLLLTTWRASSRPVHRQAEAVSEQGQQRPRVDT
ncbi:signal peptidase II [Micromonospora sp. HM5-17]|uniref:signal peptidase II n=1 Tax=Micromonospora sp. HM5-17 TaxID=2487710 RepID=UPI000F4AA8F2|nr:signal peptidase II [Micromonospora sp. HM5-17]ROT33471.1 hypothetical protein EF879_00345 [Micromonospora sp. HM5-17]